MRVVIVLRVMFGFFVNRDFRCTYMFAESKNLKKPYTQDLSAV